MKLIETYRNLILEEAANSCIHKYGRELFGAQLGGNEPNTRIEDHYAEEIKDFTDNKYGEEVTSEFMDMVRNLRGCLSTYPEVLIPEATSVFRGINVPIKNFILKKQLITLDKAIPYTYKASSKIQSWTDNLKAAERFGSQEVINEISKILDLSIYNTPEARRELLDEMINEDLRIAFVLEYKSNKVEFIFKSRYFKMLSKSSHEDELIRISNKPINTLAIFNNDKYTSPESLRLIHLINKAIAEF